MATALRYSEFAVPPSLRSHVRCIWRMCGEYSAGAPEPIVPDGCAELILNFGDPFVHHSEAGCHRQPLRLVAGQITRAITIHPSGSVSLWGVRFHPWGAAPMLGFAGAEMRDRLTSVDELSAHVERELMPAVDATSEALQHAAIVGALTRVLVRARPLDTRVAAMVTLVAGQRETFTVRGLARHVGLSARRVELLFRDEIGLSPKQLHRINRFQHAMALRRAKPRLTWSAVASRAGYYDQAHLIHDSRDIAGCTPSELTGDLELTEAFLSE
jgi:AraC-like DNA-binding protein